MPGFSVKAFTGAKPRLDPELLKDADAQVAHNCYVERGKLTNQNSALATGKSFPATPLGLRAYYGRVPGDLRAWLWTRHETNIVLNLIPNDRFGRLFFRGDNDHIRVTDNSEIGNPSGGALVELTENNSWWLGVPAPTTKPTAAKVGDGSSDVLEQRAYIYTYVNYWGEESAPSPVSNIVYQVRTDGTVNLTGIEAMANYRDIRNWEATHDPQYRITDFKFRYWWRNTGDRDFVTTMQEGDYGCIVSTTPQTYWRYESGVWVEKQLNEQRTTAPFPVGRIRIYRSVSGVNRTDYQFVDDIDNLVMPDAVESQWKASDFADGTIVGEWAFEWSTRDWYRWSGTDWIVDIALSTLFNTLTYTDTKLPEELGEVNPTAEWIVPPMHATEIVGMANGTLACFYRESIYFSLPYLPYGWPPKYRVATETNIIGITPILGSLVAATQDYPYYITGSVPVSIQVQKLDFHEACVSKRSLISIGNVAFYASPNGIAMIRANQGGMATTQLVTREQWQELNPESMFAFSYKDDLGLMFTGASGKFPMTDLTEGTLWMDPDEGYLRTDDLYSPIIAIDTKTERTYGVDPATDDLIELYGSTVPLPVTWKTKKFRFTFPLNMAAMVVEADIYPVNVTLYADGDMVFATRVDSDDVVRLPSGFEARRWEAIIDFSARAVVQAVHVYTSVKECTAQ